MLRNYDEDSGRSSCSAASIGLSPIMDHHDLVSDYSDYNCIRRSQPQDCTSNKELIVSSRPRSCVIQSPDERDPFPSYRQPKGQLLSLFDNTRQRGLSNAHSTFDIVSSTQIEHPKIQQNAVSLSAINSNDNNGLKKLKPVSNFRRGKPVQRAASRLYRAESGIKGNEGCTGPEFIVRASQPEKHIDLTVSAISEKKVITVVLLNGQRVEVLCDPNTVTAGQLFEALVHSEKYEHNFMLGIAFLNGGDFVFIPDDYKIKKVAPENWHKVVSKKGKTVEEQINLTVFLRIKFFLPTNIARNIQGGEWRYRVYLQLRRATVEGQLTSTIQNLVILAGYALHIEFGEVSYREHGSGDYFLLEHYLPETLITNEMSDIKLKMKRAHESRRGLDRNMAIINYITLAQTFRDYGAHFYSAVWATRDGFCRDVWLSIGPRGVTLYSRNSHVTDECEATTNRIVLQSLPWHHIHTFYYNKKSLYIMPNSYSGLSKIGVKYKLKLLDNKSYFVFWLASLHHRLYLKLYAKDDFINYLSDELSCPLNKDSSPQKAECSNYQDSYNLAVRNPTRFRKPVRRRFKVDIFSENKPQGKENQKPSTEEMLREILSPQPHDDCTSVNAINTPGNSSNEGLSSSESSLPRRHGVKMGTRVFNGMKNKTDTRQFRSPSSKSSECLRFENTTQSDSDDLSSEQRQHCKVDGMKLLPERPYSKVGQNVPTAYVLESPKVYPEVFSYNTAVNESFLNISIFEKLDKMGCVQGERVFVTTTVERGEHNALGLQVAEGSDGNVYIKSITPGGPADVTKKLLPGDQIISVNGQTLLNIKYEKALTMLQSAPKTVELIVLQTTSSRTDIEASLKKELEDLNIGPVNTKSLRHSLASVLDGDVTDDELLNEEALKTIYALIKLTKEKVISRMKGNESLHSVTSKSNLQKCHSENKVYYDDIDSESSGLENTPEKKNKFNTWRGQLPGNSRPPKRRPLSLSIPTGVNIPENYLDNDPNDVINRNSMKPIPIMNENFDHSKSASLKNVAVPRNFAVSRRWLGPVRYPVTPCKNLDVSEPNKGAVGKDCVTKKHFVYGAGVSEEDQIFL